jgi:hypothetical protein
MKYALFVLALLLVVLGCFAVYSGSQAIEVERGWSILIAGTVTAVGGALLFALAWIVRTLEQLRATLQTAGIGATAAAAVAPAAKLADVDAPPEPVRPEYKGFRPKVAPPPPPAPPAPPGAAIAWPPHTSPAVPESGDEEMQDFEAESAEDTREIVEYASFEAEANTILNTPFTEETARPAVRAKPVSNKSSSNVRQFWNQAVKDSDGAAPPARNFSKAKSEPPPEPFAQPKPVAPLRPVPRPSEDERVFEPAPEANNSRQWLDRKFPRREVREESERQDEVGDELGEELEAFTETAAKEPPPPLIGEPPPSAAEVVADEPAVIGRYDAEGTCYTMFADGSIEAQSERGVFRFKSMEELKAYFETLREPQ